MRIDVDRTRCAGIGICESLSPKHFEVDDGGDLVLLEPDVGHDDLSDVREAIEGCPTQALSLHEG